MKTPITKKDWHILCTCATAFKLFIELVITLWILDKLVKPDIQTICCLFFIVGFIGVIISSIFSWNVRKHYHILPDELQSEGLHEVNRLLSQSVIVKK